MRLLAALVAIWVAYFLGRGHEYRAWMTACDEFDEVDDIDWLLPDTYLGALLRRTLEV